MPGHDAWVQYSLCTNVNALFFKVPMLEFRQQWVQGWDLALGNLSGYRVLVFMLVLGESSTLYSVLSSHFTVACGRAKWSKHVHSNTSGTQGANTTSFCAGTQAIVLGHQVWTATFMTSPKNRLLTSWLGVKLKHSRQKWWPCFYPREKKWTN